MTDDKFEKWLEKKLSRNNNYQCGQCRFESLSKYRAFKAEKPTATASLSQAVVDFGKWLIDLSHDYPGQRVDISLIEVKFTDMVGKFEHTPVHDEKNKKIDMDDVVDFLCEDCPPGFPTENSDTPCDENYPQCDECWERYITKGLSKGPSDKPAEDLQGQHAQMVALAKAHGLDIAADWAVNMSGKTFSEEKPTSSSGEQGIKTVRVVCPLKDPQRCVTCMDSGPCDGYIHVDMPAVPSQEPLAVLADRKGVSFEVCPPSFYVHNVGVWDIGIGEPKKGLYTLFKASTYAEAEAKARAYLEGLPDVEKEGR